jgi:hypothetical protein
VLFAQVAGALMAWHLWISFSFINDDVFYNKALGIGASECLLRFFVTEIK